MATKKEMVQELINMGVSEDKSTLLSKKNSELEKMIEGFSPTDNKIDIEEIKKKIEEETRQKIEAEMRQKIEAEMKANSKPKQIDRYKLVTLMSLTSGKLVYVSPRTGMKYIWGDYGDTVDLEMHEIQTMRTSTRSFLNEPHAIVLDDEVCDYLGLNKDYGNLIDVKNIDEVFSFDNEKFEEVLDSAPRGIKMLIIDRVKNKVKDGSFDSAKKIKILNEKYNLELEV